jgi:hypothetical protein
MTTPLPLPASSRGRSPFAGADVCQRAGLTLPPRARRPVFDDDLWDFTDVSGLPVSMPLSDRRFSFTPIASPRWRLVAKELIFAMLAPRHEAVALLPRANRTPVHLHTALHPPGGGLAVPELAHQPGRCQPGRGRRSSLRGIPLPPPPRAR